MSLGNLVVQKERAYLVTDSGYFRDDGTIICLFAKSMEFPEQHVAICTVGSLQLGHMAAALKAYPDCKAWTQRQLLSAFPKIVREAYDGAKLCPDERWSRLLVAFYSHEHGEAGGFTLFTSARAGPADKQPWRFYSVPAVLMPDVDWRSVCGQQARLTDPAKFNPATDFMPIVDAQRGKRGGWDGLDGDYSAVAGEIVLTTVSAAGIEHTTLHEYPDLVGGKAG